MKEIKIPILYDFYPNLYGISKRKFNEIIFNYFFDSIKNKGKLVDLPTDEMYLYNFSKFSLEDVTKNSFKLYEEYKSHDLSLYFITHFNFFKLKKGFSLNVELLNSNINLNQINNVPYNFAKKTSESLFSIIAYSIIGKFEISQSDFENYKQLSKFPKVVYNPSLTDN
jgi:hypothetical protein